MPFIIPANTLASGGFEVDNSCRFNDGSSDKLARTPSSNGSYVINTWSFWVKRSALGADQILFSAYVSGSNKFRIRFNANDTLQVGYFTGVWDFEINTNRVFRDVSAFYNIVITQKADEDSSDDRIKIYVNGVRETSFGTNNRPSLNEGSNVINATNATQNIGASGANNAYFDGYMSEVVRIDGTAYQADSFGEFDEDSGIWKPINVSGLTFGTNGFYLEFKESGTSANSSGIGADTSGKNNHLTVTNLTAIDQSTDTPTNNFCTINPLVNGTQRNPTLSEGNTFLTNTSGAWKNCLSSFAASSGKWYFEIKPTLHGTSYVHAGIFPVDDWQNQVSGYPNFGGTANSWSYDSDGNIVNNDGNANTSPATYTTNNIIGIAVDLDNNKFYAYKNNALQVAGGTSINANIEYYFGGMGYNSNIAFNFGNPSYANSSSAADGNGYGAFEYAPPSGFFSINTKNLAEYG